MAAALVRSSGASALAAPTPAALGSSTPASSSSKAMGSGGLSQPRGATVVVVVLLVQLQAAAQAWCLVSGRHHQGLGHCLLQAPRGWMGAVLGLGLGLLRRARGEV